MENNNNDNERKNSLTYKIGYAVGYTLGVTGIACAIMLLIAFTVKCMSWLLF